MVYFITKSTRAQRKSEDIHGAKVEAHLREHDKKYNSKDSTLDYDTPVSKSEYIGMLQKKQETTKDSHLASQLQKEIKHTKEHGSNSGLK